MADSNPADSILTSTKKVLGVAEAFTEFDLDITTHINATLTTLNQIGLGPEDVVVIEDKETEWVELELPPNQLSLARTYIYMKVRMLFDPPATGFLIDALNNVIKEQETRLSYLRETG